MADARRTMRLSEMLQLTKPQPTGQQAVDYDPTVDAMLKGFPAARGEHPFLNYKTNELFTDRDAWDILNQVVPPESSATTR